MHGNNWKAARDAQAYVALEDGSIFHGYSVGADCDATGEAVFNTGMTGYQEILSDPSYAGQFVCLTMPETGAYGVHNNEMESRRYFASGLLVHRISQPSGESARGSLAASLRNWSVPAIAGIDTRALTSILRERGTMNAFICATGSVPEREGVDRARTWEGLSGQDYVSRVTCREPYKWDASSERFLLSGLRHVVSPLERFHIVAYDFGIKWNILRCLYRQGMTITVVPAETSASDVLALNPDGVFLSNGPADPAAVGYAVAAIRELLGKVAIFGICLGHQLLGIALGGRTYRLPFGHHGSNHPVKDLLRNRTLVTSQNHNFALREDSLSPELVEVTQINLNDGSVEALRAKAFPAFSVQYHPEATPGPHDAGYIFQEFRDLICSTRQQTS